MSHNEKVKLFIKEAKPWQTGLNAKILEIGHVGETGRLPQEWRTVLIDTNLNNRVYVVYSYLTPIAWAKLDKWDFPREWVVPGFKYTTTTSRHQNLVRQVLAEIGWNWTE